MLPSLILAAIPGFGPVAAIASFLAKNWKIILIAIAAIAIGLFVLSWDARGRATVKLEQQNAVLQGNVTVLQKEAQQAREAEQAAADRLKIAAVRRDAAEHLVEEANRAPSTDDAPLAPVLRRSITGLGSLRNSTSR